MRRFTRMIKPITRVYGGGKVVFSDVDVDGGEEGVLSNTPTNSNANGDKKKSVKKEEKK